MQSSKGSGGILPLDYSNKITNSLNFSSNMPSVTYIIPDNGIIGIYSGVYGSGVTFSINGFYYGFYSGNTEKSGGGSFSRIVNKGDVVLFSGSGPYGWGKNINYEFIPFKKS